MTNGPAGHTIRFKIYDLRFKKPAGQEAGFFVRQLTSHRVITVADPAKLETLESVSLRVLKQLRVAH